MAASPARGAGLLDPEPAGRWPPEAAVPRPLHDRWASPEQVLPDEGRSRTISKRAAEGDPRRRPLRSRHRRTDIVERPSRGPGRAPVGASLARRAVARMATTQPASSAVEALARFTALAMRPRTDVPDDLRSYLTGSLPPSAPLLTTRERLARAALPHPRRARPRGRRRHCASAQPEARQRATRAHDGEPLPDERPRLPRGGGRGRRDPV